MSATKLKIIIKWTLSSVQSYNLNEIKALKSSSLNTTNFFGFYYLKTKKTENAARRVQVYYPLKSLLSFRNLSIHKIEVSMMQKLSHSSLSWPKLLWTKE